MRSCCTALGTISRHLRWNMMEDYVKKNVCVCVSDWVTLLYSRKLAEHCQPTLMEKTKIILKINHWMLTKSLVLLSECFIPCPTGQTSKQTFAEELMVPCLRRKERLWEVKSEATLGQSVYCSLCVEGLQGKWSSLGRMWILNTAMEQNFVHFCLLFCLLSFLPASSFLPSTNIWEFPSWRSG